MHENEGKSVGFGEVAESAQEASSELQPGAAEKIFGEGDGEIKQEAGGEHHVWADEAGGMEGIHVELDERRDAPGDERAPVAGEGVNKIAAGNIHGAADVGDGV